MTYILSIFLILTLTANIYANPLDDNCPTFVLGKYPVVAATTKTEYVCHTRYGVAYDDSNKITLYVATKVNPAMMNGKIVRGNDFKVDPLMDSKYAVKPSDYVGTPYDKGHLAEAELFTTDEVAMHESFYMSNMHPQLANFNRGIWKSLETYTHKLAARDTIYIISGTVYGPKSSTIGKSVTVPEYSWKIIQIPSSQTTEAYLIPNVQHDKIDAFKKYKVSVKEIEVATGLKF